MEITPNAFKAYIQAAFVPVVVVLCTEGVEKICQKQGFKFVDAFKSAIVEKKRSMNYFNTDLCIKTKLIVELMGYFSPHSLW